MRASLLLLFVSTAFAKAIPQPQAGVPGGITPDGTCGGLNGYICLNSLYGQCCGPYGYCGSDSSDCEVGYGCQIAYGNCSSGKITTRSSTTSFCTTSSSTTSITSSSSSTAYVYGGVPSESSLSFASGSAPGSLTISISASGIGSVSMMESVSSASWTGSESSTLSGSLTISGSGSPSTGSGFSSGSSTSGSGSSATSTGPISASFTVSGTVGTGSGLLTSSGSSSTTSSSTLSSASATPTAYYHLRTHVIPGQPWADGLDGLYMSAYPTRTGFNDVVFYATKDPSQVGWFGVSDTMLHWFEPRNDTAGAVTFTLVMDYIQTDDWAQVSIDKGPGTAGLALDYQTGLVVSTGFAANVWNGWFVCRWWHAALPQLFWLITPPGQIADLGEVTNCAIVQLVPELVLVP